MRSQYAETAASYYYLYLLLVFVIVFSYVNKTICENSSSQDSSTSANATNGTILSSVIPDGENYKLEWIGEPTIETEVGPPRTISSYILTDGVPNEVSVQREITRTFKISRGAELKSPKLLDMAMKLKPSFSITNAEGKRTALEHKISLDKYTMGRVMFSEMLVAIKGRVRKTYLQAKACELIGQTLLGTLLNVKCNQATEELEIEVRGAQLDETGNLIGVYSVQYNGTDKFKHPEFYNLVNRTSNFEQAMRQDAGVRSARECGELAVEADKKVALYLVKPMECFLMDIITSETNSNDSSVSTHDRDGYLLGKYLFEGEGRTPSNKTSDKHIRDVWKKERKCDVIQDVRKDGERTFTCINYQSQDGHVLMFRRLVARPKRAAASSSSSRRSSSSNNRSAGYKKKSKPHQSHGSHSSRSGHRRHKPSEVEELDCDQSLTCVANLKRPCCPLSSFFGR